MQVLQEQMFWSPITHHIQALFVQFNAVNLLKLQQQNKNHSICKMKGKWGKKKRNFS